jgi:preprotein translocase subunit SecB
MPFKKDESGNPSGRPRGAKNKVNVNLRSLVNDFLTNKFPVVLEKWETLSDKEQLKFYREMMQYGLPKLQSVDLNADLDLTLSSLSEEQLDDIIERMMGNSNQ